MKIWNNYNPEYIMNKNKIYSIRYTYVDQKTEEFGIRLNTLVKKKQKTQIIYESSFLFFLSLI